MSARAAAVEALRTLVETLTGAAGASEAVKGPVGVASKTPGVEEALRLARTVQRTREPPDPYVLKVLRFFAERAVRFREVGAPWALPAFRLFSEAFMLSSEFREAVARGLSAVRPLPGSAAVDAMSCTGVCLELASSQWRRLVAVDPSPHNLELIEERLRSIGASNYELYVGSMEDLPRIVREPVGLVIAASPSTWFLDARVIIDKAYTTLEPSGHLLLVTPTEREGAVNPLAPFIIALGGSAPLSIERLEDAMLEEGFARTRRREGDLLTTILAVKP